RDGRLSAAVALDCPFRGYHDLSCCYETVGWRINAGGGPDPGGEAFSVYSMTFPLSQGLLCFGLLDEGGHWLAPPEYDADGRIPQRVKGGEFVDQVPTYQA